MMNLKYIKISAFLFFNLLISINIWAIDINQLEDSASFYYNKADYTHALVFYDSIISENYSSTELFLNTGNCHYQLGDLANAIFYYEKSLKLDPNNDNIKHNLSIANKKVECKTEQLPIAFYKRWFNSVISIMSSDNWAIFSIISFVISLIFAGLYLFSTNINLRKTGFSLGLITLVFTVLSIIFSVNLSKRIVSNNFAIVFEKCLVKSSPNEESNNLFEVPVGLKVEIVDSLDLWYNISLSDGKQGWIIAKNIKRI